MGREKNPPEIGNIENLPSTGNILEDIAQDNNQLDPIRQAIAQHVEAVLQQHEGYAPRTVRQGLRVAREINDYVEHSGCRLRYPAKGKKDVPATLAFNHGGTTTPGLFMLRSVIDGVQRTSSSKVLQRLRVMLAPPDARRLRKKTRKQSIY